MKKVFLICFLLSILSCQSNTCYQITQYLADKVSDAYECNKPEVFYKYLQNVCPSKDPGSVIGKVVCRISVNYISDNINQFSKEADCKKDFISDSVKEGLIDTCSMIVP